MFEDGKVKVKVSGNGTERVITCNPGDVLMNALKENGIFLDAPCGGKGLCGKCKVRVISGEVQEMGQNEERFINQGERNQGVRLACCARVLGDVEIGLISHGGEAYIQSQGRAAAFDFDPLVKKRVLKLPPPDLEDQRDDAQRLLDCLGEKGLQIPLEILGRLPYILRDNDFKVTVIHDDRRIISVKGDENAGTVFGIAVDIGTTTVVAYLIDLETGKTIDSVSGLNRQKSFGADVISRITYSIENPEGLKILQKQIVAQIVDFIEKLSVRNKIDKNSIAKVAICGNTTMVHLFCGFPPKYIANAPFIPVNTGAVHLKLKDLDGELEYDADVYVLPCVSGYIGADIVAGILSCGMSESPDLSLLIDIGTNGEIVLGNRDSITCCSTAAGPAFEGAHIRDGMGGAAGAVNMVSLKDGSVTYTTIGNSKPVGICGSGIIDIVAELLREGIIDETGRFVEEDEVEGENQAKLYKRVVDIDGMRAFVIAEGAETESGEPIVFTQKDIREVQLAKAAIAAGIKVLLNDAGLSADNVKNIFLAGGFGSYMNVESALTIGLIPKEFKDKITAVGNSAGEGTKMVLLSRKHYFKAAQIGELSKYLELSAAKDFQDEYINCMYFE